MYKLDAGAPLRWRTRNGLHNRVPLIIWDDFGAQANKATTWSDPAWNLFKGGFDTLGTEVGVLIATMVSPEEPTLQIKDKFTHEVFIPCRGVYKYDSVTWQQNYKGWRSIQRKKWIEEQEFFQVPRDVEIQYNEMRNSLAQEIKQRIKDRLLENELPKILRLITDKDLMVLKTLRDFGPIRYNGLRDRSTITDGFSEVLVRLKARDLMIALRKKDSYEYDITNLGLDVLETLAKENDQKKVVANKTISELPSR